MKDNNIIVFKKVKHSNYDYIKWIAFDKEDELIFWLETTLEDKKNLLVTRRIEIDGSDL